MAKTDAPDSTITTTRRPPRQRRKPDGLVFAAPDGYARARRLFEDEAQRWLLARPSRIVVVPDDLAAVAGIGVPCERCGASVYRDGGAGHVLRWRRDPDGHWAAGITATCAG